MKITRKNLNTLKTFFNQFLGVNEKIKLSLLNAYLGNSEFVSSFIHNCNVNNSKNENYLVEQKTII